MVVISRLRLTLLPRAVAFRYETLSGRLALVNDPEHGLGAVRKERIGEREDLLVPVFRNGELLRQWRFEEIRLRAGGGSISDTRNTRFTI